MFCRPSWPVARFMLLALLVLTASETRALAAPATQPIEGVKVIGVRSERGDGQGDVASRYDAVIVKVSDIKKLHEQAAAASQKIILFFDGLPLKGVTEAKWKQSDGDSGEMWFNLTDLDNSDDARKTWAGFVRQPGLKDDRPVRVSVGLEKGVPQPIDAPPAPAEPPHLKLRVISDTMFWVCFTVFVAVLIIFLLFAFLGESNLIRDSDAKPIAGRPKPFSLGRSQMAFWFFLVIAAYLLLWIVTGSYNSPSAGVLALIGISAATTVSAALIDSSKDANKPATAPARLSDDQILGNLTRLAQLEDQIRELTVVVATPPEGADAATVAKNKEDLEEAIKSRDTIESEMEKGGCPKSAGFWRDILSDENGMAFHRFQMVVWTLVLGVIFVASVFREVAMPNFDASLLGLMGISSGTYLGFKFK